MAMNRRKKAIPILMNWNPWISGSMVHVYVTTTMESIWNDCDSSHIDGGSTIKNLTCTLFRITSYELKTPVVMMPRCWLLTRLATARDLGLVCTTFILPLSQLLHSWNASWEASWNAELQQSSWLSILIVVLKLGPGQKRWVPWKTWWKPTVWSGWIWWRISNRNELNWISWKAGSCISTLD